MGFYLVPLCLVLTVALVVLCYNVLKVDNIVIDGQTRYQSGEIINASGIEIGRSMFKVKPSSAIHSLQQKLSYIGDAALRFELPNTVVLEINEAQVACSAKDSSGYVLLDKNLKVLQADSAVAISEAPVLIGIDVGSPVAGEKLVIKDEVAEKVLTDLFAILKKNEITAVREIDMTDLMDIKLTCDSNMTLLLGSPTKLDYKIEFTKCIMDKYLESGGGYIINAQTLESEYSPNISVLPAKYVAPETPPVGDSDTPPGDTGAASEADNQNKQSADE